ncbi:hypothetical protein [Bradyrhizobium sp. USDA 4451]
MFHDGDLNRAVNQCYLPQVAVDHLKAVFGERISDRPDLVKFTQPLRRPFWRHALLRTRSGRRTFHQRMNERRFAQSNWRWRRKALRETGARPYPFYVGRLER